MLWVAFTADRCDTSHPPAKLSSMVCPTCETYKVSKTVRRYSSSCFKPDVYGDYVFAIIPVDGLSKLPYPSVEYYDCH